MTLKIAIVGAGRIARSSHLPAWSKAPGAKVVSIVDSDLECAAQLASDWRVDSFGTSYEEALENRDIDAIDLCVPGRLHVEMAVKALNAGKHVLIEKPLSTSLQGAKALAECAKQHPSLVAMVAENWLYSQAFHEAMEMIGEGKIGEIIILSARHLSRARLPENLVPGLGDWEKFGYLMTAGIHSLNASLQIMGELRSVDSIATIRDLTSKSETNYPIETDMVLIAEFLNGGIGTFEFSGRSLHDGERKLEFRLQGTEGVLEFDILSGEVSLTTRDGLWSHKSLPASMGFREEIEHFVYAIQSGNKTRSSVESQIAGLEFLDAAYRSLVERARIVVMQD